MKKHPLTLISILLVLALAAGCAPSEPAAPEAAAPEAAATQAPADSQAPAEEVFKIGMMAPGTGDVAFLGENMKRLA
jgi:PBP1b-binding outer membrane lipoprotein LpoB